jgi:hypothetical protein
MTFHCRGIISSVSVTSSPSVDGLFGPDTFAAMTRAIQQAVLKTIESFGIVPDSDADKLLQVVIQKILSKTI